MAIGSCHRLVVVTLFITGEVFSIFLRCSPPRRASWEGAKSIQFPSSFCFHPECLTHYGPNSPHLGLPHLSRPALLRPYQTRPDVVSTRLSAVATRSCSTRSSMGEVYSICLSVLCGLSAQTDTNYLLYALIGSLPATLFFIPLPATL